MRTTVDAGGVHVHAPSCGSASGAGTVTTSEVVGAETSEVGAVATRARAWRTLAPTGFVAANALAFLLVLPGVPDLWAARARAFAAAHGVGLTYWFGWFGGSTPGDYSVLTPYLCSVLGTALVASLAAVTVCAVTTALVRDTRHPRAAAWSAAAGVLLNLWCGRVPFLLGAAFGVAALLFLRRRRTLPAATLTVLSVLASPVSGVFVALGVSGVLLSSRTRAYRVPVLITGLCALGTLLALAFLFGVPGPEPLPLYLIGEIVLVLGLLLLTRPPAHLRLTLIVCAAVALVIFTVPNGLGANLARLALFCLPPAALALSRRGPATLTALMIPILVLGALSSVSSFTSASLPASTAAYYTPLATEMDGLPGDTNHRLELVGAAHAAYAALLGHAVLARGWETQEDRALNGVLRNPTLGARGYRAWLDSNAVGYVAQNEGGGNTPEARVIRKIHPGYLHPIWSSAHWTLYQVRHARPIVARPADLEASTQSQMTVQVPCACTTSVRVRWSKFLEVSPELPRGTPDSVEDSYAPMLVANGSGWTTLKTNRSGTYVLSG